MTKSLVFLLLGGLIFFTSCETTKEISINADHSGTLVTTTDMSGMIGMAKLAGQGKGELDDLKDKAIDTSFSLASMADSLEGLSAEDKNLVKKGKLYVTMNLNDDKFIVKSEFPFSEPGQISRIEKLSSKFVEKALKDKMTAAEGTGEKKNSPVEGMPASGGMPEGSVDDYYVMTYAKGVIEKKLIKEKYAKVNDDEDLKGLKEMSQMGAGNSTLIFNLPRPAKKAEGKNVKLSDDKKKVTVTNNMDDFFDDGTALEFRIEY